MEKINFVNNSLPAINDTNLNKLQDNVEDAIDIVQTNVNTKLDGTNIKTTQTTSATNTYSCNYINGIVESGSNANGSWIKYIDGTMICWKTYTFSTINFNTAWGSMYESASQNFGSFPQSFVSMPTIFANNGTGATAWLEPINNGSLSEFGEAVLVRPVSGNASGTINLLAIGKWK